MSARAALTVPNRPSKRSAAIETNASLTANRTSTTQLDRSRHFSRFLTNRNTRRKEEKMEPDVPPSPEEEPDMTPEPIRPTMD